MLNLRAWKRKKPLNTNVSGSGIHVSDPLVLEKLKMIQLTDQDLENMVKVKPLVMEHIDEVVDEFYRNILEVNELRGIIESNSTVERLRQTLRTHVIEMFDGKVDQAFLEKRLRVAKAHYRIRLKPAWYMGAFQNLQHALFRVMVRGVKDPDEFHGVWVAVIKLLGFEQQLVLEAYNEETEREIHATYKKGREHVKRKIEGVSDELLSLSDETNASMETLISNSQEVFQLVEGSIEQAKRILGQVREGGKTLVSLMQQLEQVKADTRWMTEAVQQLENSSKQITKVVEMMQEIAGQTHLLALNSAIEAARAGEYGQGFAVVAAEVKKLAERTKTSIAEVQHMLEASQRHTFQVADALQRVENAVTSSIVVSQTTKEAFRSMNESIAQNEARFMEMEGQVEELVKAIEEIGTATAQVAASAETLNETAQLG